MKIHDTKRRVFPTIDKRIASFPEGVQAYIGAMQDADRSPQTINGYVYDFSLFFSFLAREQLVLEEVTENVLHKFFQEMGGGYQRILDVPVTKRNAQLINQVTEDVQKTYQRANARSGKQRKQSSLRSLFCYLVRTKRLPNNPMEAYDRTALQTKRKKTLPTFLSREEAVRLVAAVDSFQTPQTKGWHRMRNRAILMMLLGTGIRVSELVQLRFLHIHKVEEEGVYKLLIIGKGEGERWLTLHKRASEALDHYLVVRPIANPLLPPSQADIIFLNKNKGPMSRRSIGSIVKKYALEANLPVRASELTPHKLRHTLATFLLSQGENLRIVQEILGHSCVKTTQIYTHVVDSEKEEALRKLDKIW